MHALYERLASGHPILADGAMGTELYARGVPSDRSFDAQNLDAPTLVEQIHRDYIRAGADLIETNTFAANAAKLSHFGLETRVRDINVAGARIARGAREVTGENVLVAGSVGPTSRTLQPFGQTKRWEVYDIFAEQVGALVEGGVDLLILETFADLAEILEAIRAARAISDLPIVAQMTFSEELVTPVGHSPEQVVAELSGADVQVIGANCSVGPSGLLQVVERLAAAGASRISAMPNAGWPTRAGNRVLYHSSPGYMAELARNMVEAGATIVGGCCGTGPSHVAAFRQALSSAHAPQRVTSPLVNDEAEVDVSDGRVSGLAGLLGTRPVISVEIRPPRGANPAKAVQGAQLVREAGADSVNVLDSAMARVRMSGIATAALIKQQTGIETILHFTTRDRNLMAIQSDLVGAHALGIRAVLALTGDPPSLGDYATSKAVYDVDSVGLIRIIKRLNAGEDIGGNSIGSPTQFLVGAALNPMADDLELEIDRFRQKLDAGADFVMTQPVYDSHLFQSVLDRIGRVHVPILMGVLPLQSYRHALFLHNELPGVHLTDDVLRRMEAAGTTGVDEGLRIAREMIVDCASLTAGLYIMPSFGRYEVAAQLVSSMLQAV